jgi:class 3 adenylate cyclase
MRCSNCGSENPSDAAFCEQCGRKLELLCPACRETVSADARFCRKCGTSLSAVPVRSETIAASPSPGAGIRLLAEQTVADVTGGERKTVTALFADIKGSMELMEALDPEEARALIDPALKLMIEAVHSYDGYVIQSTGDGIFALFGAPVAHEDHPQLALYAALRMQGEIERYSAKLRQAGQLPIEVRVGLNTGEVVARSIATGDSHAEYAPIGHSASIAARMQALAPTGSIVVTDTTRKLCEGYFTFKSLGPMVVKGVSEPVEVFEVTGLGPLHTRFQRAAMRGLTKFVGRQHELDALKHAAEQAQAGHGQIVAVMADPGNGKSRLFHEFKANAQSGWRVLEAYSVSHGKASAYLPVLELLRGYFEISSDDDDRQRRERILGKVLGLDRSLEDTLPYLYSLHGVADSGDSLAQMDPQIRRRRTLEAIKRILLRESLNQPLMLIFEDLHWIDGETQALLNLLVDAIANARILLLVNYRPEYRHEWGSRTHYTQLRLDPLGRENAAEMLSALLGDEAELEPLKRLIADKTEGNPFFLEEIVQALFEQGVLTRNGRVKLSRSLADITIPPTVQAVLASRIDRLPPREKELLQRLAVMGREFQHELIQCVAGIPEAELERMLDNLQSGGFVYEQPAFPDVEYSFKHALTQEVAYHSVLIGRRKLLHERTGAAIESLYAPRIDEHLEELAHHYNSSHNVGKAVKYLDLASAQALKRLHNTEAITRATAGLQLLNKLPIGSGRAEAELSLQLTLGLASMPVLGWAAPEVGNALDRAATLARETGGSQQTFAVLGGLYAFYLIRADHRRANQLASEMLEIANKEGSEVLSIEGHFALGTNLFWQGKFAESLEHLKLGALVLPDLSPINIVGADTPASAMACQASCLSHLGFPGKTVAMCRRALERASSLNHPFTAAAIRLSVVEAMLRISPRIAEEEAERIISISIEYGFPLLEIVGKLYRNFALLYQKGDQKVLMELADLISAYKKAGNKVALTIYLAALAKGYGDIGAPEQGLKLIEETLIEIEQTAEYYMSAELHRLKGELLLMQAGSNSAVAERYFRIAIEIARDQQAKSWELRAVMSLARLLRDTNRGAEAHTVLAEIYNWFTEGFDTTDLKEAKALLDELTA